MHTGNHPIHFEAPSLEELQPLFPNYRIEGLIAQGGMGAVYRGYQTSLDRPVAIKILPREFGADSAFRESFTAEAKAMARLNHPNLIGVYDFGDVDGMLFIVMELVDGESLHDASCRAPVDPPVAAKLVSAICRGLAHAHEHGVLHRDIKPANILLDDKLRPKIGDFGLARHLEEPGREDEVIYGTPGYAAPELTSGGPVDERADIFSVGALLHRLLTGEEPSEHPLPSAQDRCGSPLLFDTIIARATASDPSRRYAKVSEVADNLDQSGRLRPPTALAASQAAPRAVPMVVPPPRAMPTPVPVRRTVPQGLVAAVVLGALVIGAAIFFVNRKDTEKETATTGSDEIIQSRTDPGARRDNPESTIPVEPVAPEKTETAAQGLARLKTSLAAGERSEFPVGTVTHNDSHFLVLNEPMSWSDAARFAEEHGAHLAVLPSSEDQSWLRREFHFDRALWLGAGIGVNDQWQWVDSTPWSSNSVRSEASQESRNIALSATSGIFPAPSTQANGLALQWHSDGTNPATAEGQLQRTAESARQNDLAQIAYPLGTRTRGDSHYFRIRNALSWDEARDLAKSLGGQLAAPSTPEEDEWIRSVFADTLAKGETLWLGGYRLKPGDRWQLVSGEAWNNSGWQPGQPEVYPRFNRLALSGPTDSSPAGWASGDGADGKADGLIVEWSPSKDPVTVPSFDLPKWLSGVNRKIASLVASDLDDYEKNRKVVVQDYVRLMGRIVRKEEKDPPSWGDRGRGGDRGRDFRDFRWPGGNSRTLEEIETALKESAKSGQLISQLPSGASEAFREQQKKSESDLQLLAETYDLKINGHLTYYLDGVRKKASSLAGIGYLDAARDLETHCSSIEGNLPAFLKVLFPDSLRATLPWKPRDAEPAAPDEDDENARMRRGAPGFERIPAP